MGDTDDQRAIDEVRSALVTAAARLARASVQDEALARFEPARRRMLVPRKAVMVPLGRVWRLGVLLLDADARLYATGLTTRAVDPKWPQHVAVSAEVRREQRGAAFRGPFQRGRVVNFDAPQIDLSVDALHASAGPVLLRDTQVLVRWAVDAAIAPVPFERYLTERVELLCYPPEGA